MTLFQRDDWTLFRNLNTLGQKAGVPRDRLGALVLKELVDNALDAGANVSIERSKHGFVVEDDGPGIAGTDEEVATLFSIRRSLLSTKLLRLPRCGALGNGLRVVAGAVLASGGTLRVRTGGRWLSIEPTDDGYSSVTRPDGPSEQLKQAGTCVEITLGGDLADQEDVLDLAQRAIAMRGVLHYKGKTSPWWYDSDSFFELLQATSAPLRDVLDLFSGFHPRTADMRLLDLDLDGSSSTLDRTAAEGVLSALRASKPKPRPQALGEVGSAAVFANGYAKKHGEFSLHAARGSLAAHIPAVVEVWAERLDRDASPEIEVYVNRTPITAEVNAWRGDGQHSAQTVIDGCGLNHYIKTGRAPMKIRLCVTTPYMPITTDGKEPDLKPLLSTIVDAVGSACRKARVSTGGTRTAISLKEVILEHIDEAIEDASGGGKHRFSLRQLYYAVRPLVQGSTGEEPTYGYFAAVITGYEGSIGHDVPKMYRDARGTLYHPHTGETIMLGTLSVEQYKKPEFRFNKVLYVEKGGFLPLLIDAKWPERNDCAIVTSQGFASRAARDVLDLMGDGEEEILFFCIHDADGPGTCIYEALTEATLARPKRRVAVVNLGLDPWEAVEMELATEKVERKRGEVPVADYVRERGDRWRRWLQSQRVELNAMTSPAFLAWLDSKMAEHDTLGKVVPPAAVLSEKFEEETRKRVREKLVEKILREAKVDGQVDKLCLNLKVPDGSKLCADVTKRLKKTPENPWEVPFGEIVEKMLPEVK